MEGGSTQPCGLGSSGAVDARPALGPRVRPTPRTLPYRVPQESRPPLTLLQVHRMACVPHWTRASAAWGLGWERVDFVQNSTSKAGEHGPVVGNQLWFWDYVCVCARYFSKCCPHLKLIRELWLVFGKPTRIPRAPLLGYECHRWVLGDF